MTGVPVDITITMSTMRRISAKGRKYEASHLVVPFTIGEPSLVTRDNIEQAVTDAVSDLMDRMGL